MHPESSRALAEIINSPYWKYSGHDLIWQEWVTHYERNPADSPDEDVLSVLEMARASMDEPWRWIRPINVDRYPSLDYFPLEDRYIVGVVPGNIFLVAMGTLDEETLVIAPYNGVDHQVDCVLSELDSYAAQTQAPIDWNPPA